MRISDCRSDVCSSELVEMRRPQLLVLPRRGPVGAGLPLTLRTVPVATGVIGVADETALGAVLDMAAQCRRPAQLDSSHHPPLDPAQLAVVGAAISVTVPAEDLRQLSPVNMASDQTGVTPPEIGSAHV